MTRRHNIVSEISSDFLTCQICLDTYDRPKTLSCGHFFCRDCLVDYCRSNRKQSDSSVDSVDDNVPSPGVWVHCPTCRKPVGAIKETSHLETFVDAFPDNFYVNSLKDLVAHHSRKPSLRKRGSHNSHHSLDRKLDLSVKPQRSFSFAGAVGGELQEAQSDHGPRCSEHPSEVIKFYCPNHLVVLCQYCLVQEHSHCEECVMLEEAESRFIRPRIKHLVTRMAKQKLYFSEDLKKFTLNRQRLRVTVYENQKRIDRLKTCLEDKIATCFANIKAELISIFDDEEEKCKDKHEEIQTKEAIINDVQMNLESLSRKGDAYEIASTIGAYELQVQEIFASLSAKEYEPVYPKKEIHFEENETLQLLLKEDVNIFGDVVLLSLNEYPIGASIVGEKTELFSEMASASSDECSKQRRQEPVKPLSGSLAESVICSKTHSAPTPPEPGRFAESVGCSKIYSASTKAEPRSRVKTMSLSKTLSEPTTSESMSCLKTHPEPTKTEPRNLTEAASSQAHPELLKPKSGRISEHASCSRTHSESDVITSPVFLPEYFTTDKVQHIASIRLIPSPETDIVSLAAVPRAHTEMLVCKVEERFEFLSNRFSSAEACCVLGNGDIIVISSDDKTVIRFARQHQSIKTEDVRLPTGPLGITLCSKKSVCLAVTGWNKKLFFVSANPRLTVVSSITTRVQYRAVSRIPKRLSLVAIAPFENPPVVDLLSLQGQVLKTFGAEVPIPTFMAPTGIAAATDYIFVTDGRQLLVISWDGRLEQYVDCFGDDADEVKPFGQLSGICLSGDHVLLADHHQGKIHVIGRDENGWYGTVVIEDEHYSASCWSLATGSNGAVVILESQRIHGYSIEFDPVVSHDKSLKTAVDGSKLSCKRVYRSQNNQSKVLAQTDRDNDIFTEVSVR